MQESVPRVLFLKLMNGYIFRMFRSSLTKYVKALSSKDMGGCRFMCMWPERFEKNNKHILDFFYWKLKIQTKTLKLGNFGSYILTKNMSCSFFLEIFSPLRFESPLSIEEIKKIKNTPEYSRKVAVPVKVNKISVSS